MLGRVSMHSLQQDALNQMVLLQRHRMRAAWRRRKQPYPVPMQSGQRHLRLL